jgi:hypothetical protein
MSYVLKILEDTWGAAPAGPDRAINTKLLSNDDDPYRYDFAKQWPGDQFKKGRSKKRKRLGVDNVLRRP